MKKLLTLLLAAGMLCTAANGASAVDLKVSGEWVMDYTFSDNMFTNDGGPLSRNRNVPGNIGYGRTHDGHFSASQRVRINFQFIASEALSGFVQLQVANSAANRAGQAYSNAAGVTVRVPGEPGYYTFGHRGPGGQGPIVSARLAYIDWMVPNTDVKVRMGRQLVSLPGYTFASPLFSEVTDGVVVSAPVGDMVNVTAGWLRPTAGVERFGTEHIAHSTVDLAYLAMDVTGDGFKVSPYVLTAWRGSNTTSIDEIGGPGVGGNAFGYYRDSTFAYWLGIGGELTLFDPFKFTADFVWGANDGDHRNATLGIDATDRSGWYAALGAEMKTSFGTPYLRGWYASGDDAHAKRNGSNRMPVPGAWGGFEGVSSIYHHANGWLSGTYDDRQAFGSWGAQLGIKNVSLIENVTHNLSVSYFQGTNNSDLIAKRGTWAEKWDLFYMTTKDNAVSVDFLTDYKMYKNFTVSLLLSYLFTNFDDELRYVYLEDNEYENVFRGTLHFAYNF